MVFLAKLEKGASLGGIRPAYMRVSSYNSYYEGRLINVKSSRGRRGGFAETSAWQATCRRTARRRRGRLRRERLCGRNHDGNCCACRGAYRLVVPVLSLQGSTRRHVGAKLCRVAHRRLGIARGSGTESLHRGPHRGSLWSAAGSPAGACGDIALSRSPNG